MHYQPVNDAQGLLFVSPEHKRLFIERTRNVERLIDYNNRRVMRGLELVSYPRALVTFPPEVMPGKLPIQLDRLLTIEDL